jgi:hypothetical protein
VVEADAPANYAYVGPWTDNDKPLDA